MKKIFILYMLLLGAQNSALSQCVTNMYITEFSGVRIDNSGGYVELKVDLSGGLTPSAEVSANITMYDCDNNTQTFPLSYLIDEKRSMLYVIVPQSLCDELDQINTIEISIKPQGCSDTYYCSAYVKQNFASFNAGKVEAVKWENYVTIESLEPASYNNMVLTYSWEQYNFNNDTWTTISHANEESYFSYEITETTAFRRRATGEYYNQDYGYTQPVLVQKSEESDNEYLRGFSTYQIDNLGAWLQADIYSKETLQARAVAVKIYSYDCNNQISVIPVSCEVHHNYISFTIPPSLCEYQDKINKVEIFIYKKNLETVTINEYVTQLKKAFDPGSIQHAIIGTTSVINSFAPAIYTGYNVSYTWEQYNFINNMWSAIAGATGLNYNAGIVGNNVKKAFRRKASASSNVYAYSAPVIINPHLSSNTGQTDNNGLSNHNYIISKTPYTNNGSLSVVNVTYYDGFGRPIQSIAVNQSSNEKDIISTVTYDQFGRETANHLPYERTETSGLFARSPLVEQQAFYAKHYTIDAPYAFSKTQYDNSPLNRVTSQTAPGDKWKASSVKIAYGTNTATEVKLWKTDATGNPYHSGAKYSAAQLYITETEDENGVKTREYKDKQGQVVETRQNALATSYIYDNFGLLRAVIPPKAQDMAVTATEFKELIYQYSYDTRNRVIEKKIPGMELQYMVYDNRNRVVMSQDGNLKTAGRWKVYFYDALNRPVAVGTVKSTLVRSTLQGYWNNKEATQTRSAGAYTLTTVAGMPAAEAVLSYTYYDDYTWGASAYTTGDFASAAPANITPKGQVTGTKVKVLDGSEYAVGTWLTSTVYYDFMYRPIQTHSDLYTGGKATVSTNYTFDGLPERIKEVQAFSGPPTTINQRFVYDGARRATHVYHAINGASEILVAHNTYDNLGRLNAKKQGNGEAVTTDYNIRGWIEKSTASKFNYELDYNLNGNIRTQKWNHGVTSDNVYSYAYDAYNRLLSGTTSGFGENLNYDANGNITKLVRTGGTEAGTYNYTYSGNRLIALNGNAYEYDANGNAKKDGLRGFNIEYNLLNLPRKVSKGTGSLEYVYDAAGNKLAKKLNGAFINFYCGSVVYTGGKAVEYVAHSEGIAHKSGSAFAYQYNQTDHLGNVRSVADASKAVVQATDYFPFGLAHSTSNLTKNKYLYNGKELHTELGFNMSDYGARMYDQILGVWHSIDPLAEKYHGMSPYNYCANNPVIFIDLDGRDIKIANNTAGALKNLAKIAATTYGQTVLNKLVNSDRTYKAKSVFWSTSSKYDDQTISYVGNIWLSNIDGGSASEELLMGHEIYHAYQDDKFMIRQYNGVVKNTLELERGSVGFENYIRSVYGDSPMREKYSGLKGGEKGKFNPYSFNQNGESITNYTSLGNNEKKTSFGFSYDKKTSESAAKKYYIIVSSDKNKKLNYQIYTSEDEYVKAISNW